MSDVAFLDYESGRWIAYVDSDHRRVQLAKDYDKAALMRRLKRQGYEVLVVQTVPPIKGDF